MSGLLNISASALTANQTALQTVGNNIANVNTPGYSRQSVILQNIPGQFTGGGYYGKGVTLVAIQRSYSDFLTKQATLAQSVSAADQTRKDNLITLEASFQGGPSGLGASVSNLLNAFSDIANAPNDLTARSVVLTRADEMAARFRATASQLNDLQVGTVSQLKADANVINQLASQIAQSNDQITYALGSGQTPNDLLDRRDQMIRDLNQLVQTTSVPNSDGSVSVFLAGSQPLVLGGNAGTVAIANDPFNNPHISKLAVSFGGSAPQLLDEQVMGGGEASGLLRFQNRDLVDARHLLSRMSLAIGTKINDQQALGFDLNGQAGQPMFKMAAMPQGLAATTNTGAAKMSVVLQTQPSGVPDLVASDYEVLFTSPTDVTLTRVSDGKTTPFHLTQGQSLELDGLRFAIDTSAGPAQIGDRFVLKPFDGMADGLFVGFSSPRGLAMSSPVGATARANNQGTLAIDKVVTRSLPVPPAVTLTFTSAGQYIRSDDTSIPPTFFNYAPGQPINYSQPAGSGWTLTLQGAPMAGDVIVVRPNTSSDGGNAQNMLDLRDSVTFDGGPLIDGYASLMANIGTRVQSAQSAAEVSTNIAVNLEKDRSGVAGVNLDEEAAKMLQYQQAYQASGKMLQVAQNLFDTLIQSVTR